MYYFILDGEQQGPFELNQIKHININRDTLVWKNGTENWQEASKMDELKEFLSISPPPIPTEYLNKVKTNTLNINLGIKRSQISKQNINFDKAKIRFAKGLKAGSRMILFSFLIGLVLSILYVGFKFFETNYLYYNAQAKYHQKISELKSSKELLANYNLNTYAESINNNKISFINNLKKQKHLYEVEKSRVAKFNIEHNDATMYMGDKPDYHDYFAYEKKKGKIARRNTFFRRKFRSPIYISNLLYKLQGCRNFS